MDKFPEKEPTIDDIRKWVSNRITEYKIDFEMKDEAAFRKSLKPLWDEVRQLDRQMKRAVVLALVKKELVISGKPMLNDTAKTRLHSFSGVVQSLVDQED